MDPNDFLLVVVSVVVGMAIAESLSRVTRLYAAIPRIRLYWIQVIWAGILLLLAIQFWWNLHSWNLRKLTFPAFVVLLAYPSLIYAGCVLLVPEPDHERSAKEYYFVTRRRFFGVCTTGMLVLIIIDLTMNSGSFRDPENLIRAGAVPPLVVGGLWRNERYHVALALFVACALTVFILLFSMRI